jgi:ubiquinol-cytochrome c reductase cytochrome b subunit
VYDTLMIPTPKNLNWMWIWGIVLTFCLVLQIVTGIVLVMHYTPHVDMAFASVEHIMRNVNGGYMLRYMHQNGASLFFVAVYPAHLPRPLLRVLQGPARGDVDHRHADLPADDGDRLHGLRAALGPDVVLGRHGDHRPVRRDPLRGRAIQTWLLGGPAVDNATLNRFFSLHYLLPFVIAGLVDRCTSGPSTPPATTTPPGWKCAARRRKRRRRTPCRSGPTS